MRGAMLVLAVACGAIGLAPVLFWPAVARAVGAWNPAWAGSAVPESLFTLGVLHVTLALGAILGAGWLWQRVRRASGARALTWDCGYAAPTPRMQYTAGSFAGIITEWFSWILRPVRHEERPAGPFPAKACYSEHTPETVLERVVEPAGGVVMQLSNLTRRLQHGRLQAYLLYLVVGIAALAVLVLTGGGGQ
jgi:hydrogenase-4 component B